MQFQIKKLRQIPLSSILISVSGIVLGLLIGALLSVPLGKLPFSWASFLPIIITILSTVLMTALFWSKRWAIISGVSSFFKRWPPVASFPQISRPKKKKKIQQKPALLLDTSVIIDGRIVDIAKTGFLTGTFIVLTCVLEELQRISDAKNQLKRNRGRRGLEILEELKKEEFLPFRIIECRVSNLDRLDSELLKFAKKFKGKVVTTDYNLNKVAKVSGVKVLNVNELANMVKTIVLPGEELTTTVVQRGKEKGQGVGYLPDGTMVVVEEGEGLIGQKVETVVERLFQTEAGRMIFVRRCG
ncbi:MAG: hypothetical protein FJ044_01625 [Candidatus Cloacimonetes bacterium]|nr:hypothetical protein [Candidatus Cloacimonadota bacterium]